MILLRKWNYLISGAIVDNLLANAVARSAAAGVARSAAPLGSYRLIDTLIVWGD